MTNPNSTPIPLPLQEDGSAFQAIAYPHPGLPGADGQPGPPGPPGPAGPAQETPVLWIGQGSPPDFIPGAKAGDTWLDTTTGDTYKLEP